MKIKYWLIFGLFLLLFGQNIFAQVDREFWFSAPYVTDEHCGGQRHVYLHIAAQNAPVRVIVEMPRNSAFPADTIYIAANQSYSKDLNPFMDNFIYNTPANSINNKGLHIRLLDDPTKECYFGDFTAYYDYDNDCNRDIYTLKGGNALGKEFYLPFQNQYNNPGSYVKSFSEFDIVAADNNTVVEITPGKNIIGHAAGAPFTITLQAGQTYAGVATNQSAANHPTGTRIRVISGGRIAVTISDDSVTPANLFPSFGCRDIIGDQLIPVNIIKNKYLVMRGMLNFMNSGNPAPEGTANGDRIIILATQAGTTGFIRDNGGTINFGPLAAGQSYGFNVRYNGTYVETNNNVYVFHVSGFGCEMGGAILPPITDCTGSLDVSFYRANRSTDAFFINLMVPKGAEDGFLLINSTGTNVIDASWFEEIPGSGWMVLRDDKKRFAGSDGALSIPGHNLPAGANPLKIPLGQVSRIVNTKNFFHLGVINGTQTLSTKYGYFSSFNQARGYAQVITTGTPNMITCYGDTVPFNVSGGLSYEWHYGSETGVPLFLDNPNIATPKAFCPPGNHEFFVKIRRPICFGDTVRKVNIRISPVAKAMFEVDKYQGCARLNINFTNQSTDVGLNGLYTWLYYRNGVYQSQQINSSLTQPNNFSRLYDNTTGDSIQYKVLLAVRNGDGCGSSVERTILVYPQMDINISATPDSGCHPLSVRFVTDTMLVKTNRNSYYWEFGDQGSSLIKNPVHIYQNTTPQAITYPVRLVGTSKYLCSDTARTSIKVFPFVKAGFTVDTVRGCSPFTVNIKNNSLNKPAISLYTWDFGDGTTRTSSNDTLTHTYPVNTSATPITYKLLLTVRHPYDNGCPDTISRSITVYPQSSISFISAPGNNSICDSTIVSFTTTASNAITSYMWDFGDGNTSTLKDPSHLFTNLTSSDITYRVKLTGMSNEYCNGYASRDITVHAFLDPQFAVDVPSSCAPFNANIKNKSRGGIVSYLWRYGDGGTDRHSVTDTIHQYRNSTNSVFAPQLKLVVTNSGGCKDSVVQRINVYPEITADFIPSKIIGCNPLPITFTNQSTYVNTVAKHFLWEFGDNTSSTAQNPDHIFTNTTSATVVYPVKLTVTSDYNCTAETVKNINVYPYVEAKFSVDTVNGCSPFAVNITNSSRGSITQYQWLYDDGNVDNHNSANYTHTYINNTSNNPSNQPLRRYLRLIASNTNRVCTSRDSILITIYPEADARFTTDVIQGCNPLTVRYTNQSGPGNVPVEYDWIFGDGGTSSSFSTSHTFQNLASSEKIFQTKLRAYTVYRCVDSVTLNIKVFPFIKADFSFDKSIGCSPHTIAINNSSSPGANGFQWIFGDGQTSNASTPLFNHTYRNLGTNAQTFIPKLVVSYNNQCHDTIIQSLQVFPEVTASFTQDTLKGCHPFEIQFRNLSQNATRYNWVFGDQGTSNVSDPKHTYTNFSNVDSVYNLKLTATSIFNCKSTAAKQVTVYAKPKVILELENSVNCPPFNLPIKNLSEAGDFYHWNFGDGESLVTSNVSSISHTYDNFTSQTVTYNLNLSIQSVHNCSDVLNQSINVYPRVIADFSPDTSGCSPLLVPLQNKSLRAVTYKWDFGDDISSALQNPTHKFFNNSLYDTTFNVRMIGFSQFGCSDTAYRRILIHPQPLVEFSALPSYLYFPDARLNIDNQTNDGIWNFQWNFDDGIFSTAKEPGTHEFLNWGNFNVKLNAWNDFCSDSISHRVRVFAPKTIADFDASDNGCVPLRVNFTNHSTWATSYKWEFDDGTSSTEIHPNHEFKEAGKYQVKLTTFGDGAEDVTYREVVVYPKPVVEFEVSPGYVMLPEALVHYYNTSKYGNRYLWTFGDGDTSNVFEPTHTYKELGTYDIHLSVWTEHQCFDSMAIPRAVKVDGTGILTFPNAFKPSIDGPGDGKYTYPDIKNDVFHPYHDGVEEYKLEIYDRWGELLFESTDINIGWDGYYKGELCKSDVYIWKAKGKFYNGTSFNKAGDVTILR